MKKMIFKWFVVLCIAIAFPTNQSLNGFETQAYWPAEEWRTSTPEEQGVDSELLVKMLRSIDENDIEIDSLTIIRNGYMVFDTTIHPFAPDRKHVLWSCTKSITSALFGIAIEKGFVEDIQQSVLDFFPEYTFANVDETKQAMTIEHVLTMTNGLDWLENDPSVDYAEYSSNQMMKSDDWVQFVLDRPMAQAPGTHWNYNSGASHLLTAIIQETAGMTALEFAEAYLFGPLGITDLVWDSSPQGISMGGFGLQMLPHDMAKIGYLYLNDGVWNGEQVVPSAWVGESGNEYILTDEAWFGYGYQWWISDSVPYMYMAIGAFGQLIAVIPEKNMVIVLTGDGDGTQVSVLWEFIFPATESSLPLPANPDALATLESLKASLADQGDPPVPIETPGTGSTWNHKVTYGDEETLWTSTVTGGVDADGVECFVIDTSFDVAPQRDILGDTVALKSYSYWQIQSGLVPLKAEMGYTLVSMSLSVATPSEYSYDGEYGAPFWEGKTWSYEVLDIPNIGTSTVGNWTARVVGTEEVTVPAGTFNCYRVESTSEDKTVINWWSVEGDLPCPIKQVKEGIWDETETRELASLPVFPEVLPGDAVCDSKIINTAGTLFKALMGCTVKWIKDRDDQKAFDRIEAAEEKFESGWAKAENKATKKGVDGSTASMS
ncbi:MAG: serine hydrolase, partial [Deltaproteobacteria bacterium]|nr:serine hydrolase [Deltaproteobacteria bacterium]